MKTLNKEIEMIALFNEKGSIKPVRFRLSDNEELKVIPVKSIQYVCEIKLGNEKARKFICLVEIDEVQRLCEIIYNLESLKWVLYKM